MFLKKLALAVAFSAITMTAAAACEVGARVSVVGNEFPAIQTVGAGARACTGAEVKTNLTADHQKINVAGILIRSMGRIVRFILDNFIIIFLIDV